MKVLKTIDNFSLQLSGNKWRTVGNSYDYNFLLDSSDNIDNFESDLIFIDRNTNKYNIEKYSLNTDGHSCFLTFLGQHFKILSIDNSSEPHIMKLENNVGDVLTFQSSPVIRK